MAKKDNPANRKNTGTPKLPKNAWKPGQSGNPKGAPKRGESWAELFNAIGNLTGEEVASKAIQLWSKQFKAMPKGVTLKELVVIRAYAALLDESNARLLKEVMDRAEGKIGEKLDVTTQGKVIRVTVAKDE